MKAHKTAVISKKSNIADNVTLGPYVVIEDDVTIGQGCRLDSGACIKKGTSIGADCAIGMGVCLGAEPQDLSYKGQESFLKIGHKNIFREYVTIHRGSSETESTMIGDNNYFMCFSHIGHDCRIGNNVIVCNNTLLAGHVDVEDKAFISAACLIHQFVRIGALSMIGGGVRLNKDFPPYMSTTADNIVESYNIIGLRRAGISPQVRQQIKHAFSVLYRENKNTSSAVDTLAGKADCHEVRHLIDFIKQSKRGICTARSNRNKAFQ
jgi:UDP-N-acetylglucosamine acyltransferase